MEYLKYIVIIGFLAYRFLNSGKKTQESTKNRSKPFKRTPSSQKSGSLEDILKELSGELTMAEKKTPPKEEEYQSLAKERSNRKIEIEDHQYDFRPEYEHHADTGPSISSIRSEIKKEQSIEEEGEIDFDLREAILAETILNRPEF